MPLSRMPFLICRRLFALLSQMPFSYLPPGTFATLGRLPLTICLSGTNAAFNQPTIKWHFCLWDFCLPETNAFVTFALLRRLPPWDFCHPKPNFLGVIERDICRPGTFATLRHLPPWDICRSDTFAVQRHQGTPPSWTGELVLFFRVERVNSKGCGDFITTSLQKTLGPKQTFILF